jgi:hypothetical protein
MSRHLWGGASIFFAIAAMALFALGVTNGVSGPLGPDAALRALQHTFMMTLLASAMAVTSAVCGTLAVGRRH